MSSALDLDAKIAALLQQSKPAPADVEVLLAEVERALADTGQELAQATAQALDPASTSALVTSARGAISDAQFREQRLAAAEERLRAKHQAALERVERERQAAAHAAIVERRDALAGRLETVWREHAEPLAEFLRQVAAVDEEIGAANRIRLGQWIDRTETVARGIGEMDQHRLVSRGTRVPPWDPEAHKAGHMLWPPVERIDAAALVPVEMLKFGEARAKEAKEASAARAELEETNRSHPQRRKVTAGW